MFASMFASLKTLWARLSSREGAPAETTAAIEPVDDKGYRTPVRRPTAPAVNTKRPAASRRTPPAG